MQADRGQGVACRHGVAPGFIAGTSAQPAPHAAALAAAASPTSRRSFCYRTAEGGVERELPTAGEGEQHEVGERAHGMFQPASTGPVRMLDPASGSTGWIVRPAPRRTLPSRVLGDGRRLHLSRLSRYLCDTAEEAPPEALLGALSCAATVR